MSSKSKSAASTKAAPRGKRAAATPVQAPSSDLQRRLRDFVSERPDGWNHSEWNDLLQSLRNDGVEAGDTETIGLELERERLRQRLQRMAGLGPRRVAALVGRFDTLWSLQQASAEELASVPNIPKALAARVRDEVRQS